MANKDYYKILGVEKSATKEEIKKAFKKLALKFHPDRAPEDKKKESEEQFKEINEAVSVLGDDKKRQQYDQYGSSAFQGGSSGFEGFDYSDVMSQFRSGAFGNFDDIFESLFGGGSSRGKSRARRGNDLAYETSITLEEVAKGTKQELNLNKLEHCPECHGKGAKEFTQCHHCHGSGYMKKTQRTPFGLFQQTGPCPYCNGQGQLPKDSCSSCGGDGLIRKRKDIEIEIPAGVEDGMRLRVAGEGEVGSQGGPSGDLYVIISVKEHKFFERDEDDLLITIPISFTQAVLGDEIEVPTITGKATLTIPAGTDSETTFRMRGQGMPHLRGSGKGDQMVKMQIEVPKKLNKKQKDSLKQFGEDKPSKSFFKKFFG
ncbi:molecular chaperone DnaJ [Candidatus Woesearchaeota archaeon CG_4_10_14_0_2_um_filter_33_13]|nr:MAG: molecular chaperone DnaJ [Candidatus Woesearchaeota archaeon CG_4_10_14_0_2_um_filter_33_13]